ncbi:MAG TPA: hypothetical protein VH308_04970 [Terracidiphilus sp.]|jgi:hypothetical protein|nr:hypothetical protein [Terracidiphilus sp.]
MVVGDPHAWRDRFVSFDERVLSRILHVWPVCVGLLPGQPEEDDITINLVDLLWRDSVVRRLCYYVEYQFEPWGVDANGAKFSKGQIDIGVLLDQDRDHYLAYECKRLNVVNSGTRSSLATRYVTLGMMRFLTEQYAEGLPVGCMLGYVMDGDLPFALQQVSQAIGARRTPLALIAGPTAGAAVLGTERFQTDHRRSTGPIELRHLLLPLLAPNKGVSGRVR